MKYLIFGFIIGIILISGCNGSKENSDMNSTAPGVKVKVQKIEKNAATNSQSYIGTISESESVPLSFLIPGTVEKVPVDEGQSVRKGQLLAVLDNADYQSAYQIALVKEQQAQDAFDRLKTVYEKGSLPEIKYVEVKTGLEQARSMASIAEKKLHDSNLYAPTGGTIGRRMIEPGMSIIPGTPVFQLVKIAKVKVRFPVPENEIAGITKGENVRVEVAALGSRILKGSVTEIGILSNPLSHSYMVKAELDNPEKVLKPGMVCEVNISNPITGNRIIIPLSSVQVDGNNQKYVFVADTVTGKAKKRIVKIGPLVSSGVVINHGLSTGDLLITEGYQKINNDSTIQIIR